MIEKIRAYAIGVFIFVSGIIMIPVMMIWKKKNRVFRKFWAKLQVSILGMDLVEHGTLDNDADMLVMNHQSWLDIILVESIGTRDLCWVAKKEIGDIFFFGNILHAPKMIMVERESKKSLIKLLQDAKDRLENGRQLAIFPEGTRSDGTKMRKFKNGTKVIAEKYNLKVQGIVLVGTYDIFNSKELKQKPGRVDIIYLPTVEVEKGTDWYEKLELQMNETFNEYLAKRQK